VQSQKVLAITGAGSGIGAATARRAVDAGYRVVLGGRRVKPLEALAHELGGPATAQAVACDVSVWGDHQRFVSTAIEQFGQLDAYFANAGSGLENGFLTESPERWREMIDANVLGAALSIRSCLPHFLQRDQGQILITSSMAGRRVISGSLYSCAKHAVTAMAEALRQEIWQSNVKVTLLVPGMVDTPFFDNRPDGILDADDLARAALFALDQPDHVDVNEIVVRPIHQPT
jgi:NADP-dependent 3-hydroxy acid dehydrogenase YdfG